MNDIVHVFEYSKVCARWVPRSLSGCQPIQAVIYNIILSCVRATNVAVVKQ